MISSVFCEYTAHTHSGLRVFILCCCTTNNIAPTNAKIEGEVASCRTIRMETINASQIQPHMRIHTPRRHIHAEEEQIIYFSQDRENQPETGRSRSVDTVHLYNCMSECSVSKYNSKLFELRLS